MSYVHISNHEDYTQALEDLYPLLDTPAPGLSAEETEHMQDLMVAIDKWEKKHG